MAIAGHLSLLLGYYVNNKFCRLVNILYETCEFSMKEEDKVETLKTKRLGNYWHKLRMRYEGG
jgi:hypothetical protein